MSDWNNLNQQEQETHALGCFLLVFFFGAVCGGGFVAMLSAGWLG